MGVETFIGSIKMLGFSFVMRNYAYCSGTFLPTSTNAALFSLIGTMYGGDGRATFALPDLRGRVPIHRTDTNTTMGVYPQGAQAGQTYTTLTETEMASHNHAWQVSSNNGSLSDPDGGVLAKDKIYTNDTSQAPAPLYAGTIDNEGGSAPHNNMMPYLGINFSIALQGIYPSRP